jgi:hypothetical protein
MAKRKNKLLLSDLYPELAAEREVAEEEEREREREREEPARKVQKIRKDGRPMDLTKFEEKWNASLEVCKEWKRTKGRFPKANKKDKEEMSLYNWLMHCKPGGRTWTQARWEKLNEAFGEGWEKECFPYLETGGWVGQAGNQLGGGVRDETQWDAILEAVKLFKRTHGRFPRSHGGEEHENRLYQWLRDNMDTTSDTYTQERANKLVLAFGDRWQSECFPKSIWAW